MCLCSHEYRALRGQKWTSALLELELQAIVTWVLGAKLRSLARAAACS